MSAASNRGKKRKPLEWFNTEGGYLGWPACDKCFEYMTKPGMAEAAASVGIECGKSTGLMLKEVTEAYHAAGHK